MMKQCHDGAKCQMQDKRACEHACAVRMQAPVAATLTACTALIGALGRHHVKAKPDALLRQALAALESCGSAAVEDGGQQWFDDKLVDAAHEAIASYLTLPTP